VATPELERRPVLEHGTSPTGRWLRVHRTRIAIWIAVVEGLLILRPEGRLFFVNAQNVSDQINALIRQYEPRVVALDMSRVTDIEYSALQALLEGERRAAERGITLWIAGLNPGALEVARRSELADRLGPERMLFNARAAIEKYQRMREDEGVGLPAT